MWLTKDFSDLDDLFASQCVYEECYGPTYSNLAEIKRWISDMVYRQTVSAWTIHEYFHAPHDTTVTWTFTSSEGDGFHTFDGVSIIHFTDSRRIDHVREFESTHERTYPYQETQ